MARTNKTQSARGSRGSSRNAGRGSRNASGSNVWLWLLGVSIVVALICVALFSRDERAERHRVRADHRSELARNTAEASTRRAEPKTVQMRKDASGVYYIPARINGQELEFIFDTGASSVLISQVEATLLYRQGRLSEEQSSIADGSIVSNTRIILRTVEVAGVTLHDVEASVASNQVAPLLLGQSVMSQFGSFTMDYKNNTVTFR